MKYKVGDRVRVREDLIVGKVYGGESFVSAMEKRKGNTYVIGEVSDFDYRLYDCGYYWTDEMLEPIGDES